MKKTMLGLLLAAGVLLPALTASAALEDPEARAIMEKVDAREDGDNQTGLMEMVLIDKRNKTRVRKIRTFIRDKGEDTLKLMFFTFPADVQDTGFLTFDYEDPDRDDDQWLYLPALKKTKRIATTDKSGSFMGSDLNYSDMTARNLEDYDFSFFKDQKEMEVRGKKVWVIESVPRSRDVIAETGYKKSLLFVRPDIDFVVRAVHWEESGGTLKYVDVRNLEQIDGIWVATEMHIARKQGRQTIHQTVLKLSDVRFNQDLDEEMFSIRRLEKGF